MYYRVTPDNISRILAARKLQRRSFLGWGEDNKYDVKRVRKFVLNGQKGSFYGEHSKADGT